jgi:hypothetical protein
MGIGIDVGSLTGNYGTKQNVSFLLNSLPGGQGANLNFLSDYASIKNGSYRKLMNAYYGSGKERVSNAVGNNNSSVSTSKETSQKIKDVQSAAGSLKASTDKMLATGSKSIFNTKDVTTTDDKGVTTTKKEYDTDTIYKAVSTFVKDYNNMLDKSDGANTSSIATRIDFMQGTTNANKNLLQKVGITVGADGKLSLDEATFKKADMGTVKSLFNGTGSYGYQVSAQASWIDFAATNEANKANTYNAKGGYGNNYSSGDIFNTYW